VGCKVTLVADMNPTGMEIYDVELVQTELFNGGDSDFPPV
jgi:hypothetical protein